MNPIKKIIFKIQTLFLKRQLKKAGSFMICNPLRIEGAQHIEIGNSVFIQEQAWLAAAPLTDTVPYLKISDGTYIGDFAHIYATDKIIIENNVLIANHVYISDNTHEFDNIQIPIKEQPIKNIGTVTIGENSWIGEKVSILGAHIGRHCVIGANSVVTKNIPDYSVAVGSPAKIIKRYNFKTKAWENEK